MINSTFCEREKKGRLIREVSAQGRLRTAYYRYLGGERMSEEPKKAERAPTQMRRTDIPADTILIGKKPIMAYATAVMMHYNTGAKKLTLKARGRAISTAVDVAEVVNNRFLQGGLAKNVHLAPEVAGEAHGGPDGCRMDLLL